MIKLCYKKYKWKISQGACRSFKEKTGKDLMGVFAAYIVENIKLKEGVSTFERCEILRSLHEQLGVDGEIITSSEDIASEALLAIISAAQDGIDIGEIKDAMFRVSWVVSERPDDLSEPWPVVMLETALQINDYMCKNLPSKKKAVT